MNGLTQQLQWNVMDTHTLGEENLIYWPDNVLNLNSLLYSNYIMACLYPGGHLDTFIIEPVLSQPHWDISNPHSQRVLCLVVDPIILLLNGLISNAIICLFVRRPILVKKCHKSCQYILVCVFITFSFRTYTLFYLNEGNHSAPRLL